jgi:hypothetical protein
MMFCWPQAPAQASACLASAPIRRDGRSALRSFAPDEVIWPFGDAGWSSPPPFRLSKRETKEVPGLPFAAQTAVGAGWSSPVARQAHNLKVAGSNPAPATNAIH